MDSRLSQLYQNDDNVKQFVGMMDGLAFLPINDVVVGLEILRRNIPNQAILPLLNYFSDTYILGGIIPNQNQGNVPILRFPPRFPP